MTNNLSAERVSFIEQKDQIIEHASRFGDITQLETWQKAFPDVEWVDPINKDIVKWDLYSPTELAAYVAYIANPHAALIDYKLFVQDYYAIEHEVSASEHIWYCWLAHVMRFFEKSPDMSQEALEQLLEFSAEGTWNQFITENISIPEELEVLNLDFQHQPVVLR